MTVVDTSSSFLISSTMRYPKRSLLKSLYNFWNLSINAHVQIQHKDTIHGHKPHNTQAQHEKDSKRTPPPLSRRLPPPSTHTQQDYLPNAQRQTCLRRMTKCGLLALVYPRPLFLNT